MFGEIDFEIWVDNPISSQRQMLAEMPKISTMTSEGSNEYHLW